MSGSTTLNLTPTTAPVPGTPGVPHLPRVTASDAVQRVVDYLGANPGKEALRTAKRGLRDAYRQVASAHEWAYLQQIGRIQAKGTYAAGTVQYQASAGTYPRQVTLAGGAWPAWASAGVLRINNLTYYVDQRVSDTVLTLDATLVPSADVAAGTAYTLALDSYLLPADFVSIDSPVAENRWGPIAYVPPRDWERRARYLGDSFSTPRFYTITGDRKNSGFMALRFSPAPDADQTVDFVYRRRPRDLNVIDYSAGKATVSQGTTPAQVTVLGGAFTPQMVGSVIRLAPSAAALPTDRDGETPYSEERTIATYVNASTVTVDADFAYSYSSVAYRVSDPIDVEEHMLNVLFRAVEAQDSIIRLMKSEQNAKENYRQALLLAMQADGKVDDRRAAGEMRSFRQRLANMPWNPTVVG